MLKGKLFWSRYIAEGFGIPHKEFMQILRRYSRALIEFGPIRTSTEKCDDAHLNAEQVSLLITLLPATEHTMPFKIALAERSASVMDELAEPRGVGYSMEVEVREPDYSQMAVN